MKMSTEPKKHADIYYFNAEGKLIRSIKYINNPEPTYVDTRYDGKGNITASYDIHGNLIEDSSIQKFVLPYRRFAS